MGIRNCFVLLLLLVPNQVSGGNVLNIVEAIRALNPRISEGKAYSIVHSLSKYCAAENLDARLVAALIATESGFKPNARGDLGEVGLMQLRPEFFGTHMPMEKRINHLFSIEGNLHYGISYLAGLKRVFGERYPSYKWVEFYNRGPNSKPHKFPYTKRVLSYYRQFGGQL